MTRTTRAAALTAALSLSACNGFPTDAQVAAAQAQQAKIEAAVVEVCGAVNAAAAVAAPLAAVPTVGAILPFATASCGTATAVAALVTKAIDDPATIAWAQKLAGQIREAVAIVRGRA